MASDNVVARFTDAATGLVNGLLYGSGRLTVMSGESASRNVENFDSWRDAVQAMTATAPVNGAEPVETLVPILGAASFPQTDEAAVPVPSAASQLTVPVAAPPAEKAKRGRKPRASQTPTPAARAMTVADGAAIPAAAPTPEELVIAEWRSDARSFNTTAEALRNIGLKTRASLLDDVAACLLKAANLYAVEAGLQPAQPPTI